ncbi:MAG: ABC transporter permease [Candidatus Metalachnospira sp.]|nr:ABC transporter permease [Candidatus Metalachnospira sp.]
MREDRVNWFCKLMTIIAYTFILAPMIIIVIVSFNAGEAITFPPSGFSLRWYQNIFTGNTNFPLGFINSIKIATIATVFDIFIGIFASLSVTKYNFKGRGFLVSFFTSPMFIPSISFAFVLMRMTASIRMFTPFTKILIGHLVIILPYIIRNTISVLVNYNWTVEDAAASLGANPSQVFFKITLPLIKPGIISGAMLAFLYSFDEAVISSFLTSAKFMTLPVQIINYMEFTFDPTVAAISTILMAISFVIMLLINKFVGLDSVIN